MRTLSDSERRAWVRLARTDQVGPVTFAGLIARFGSAGAALNELPRLAARGAKNSTRNFILPPEEDVAREITETARLGGKLIASCEPDFPQGLAALDPPPPVITVLGHAALLKREMIAIVGARNASALGRKFTFTLAQELGTAGLAIASGMARGIDAAAHEGALSTGTVAVLAGGVDMVYPPENEKLYDAIRAEGAILSEMRLSEAPQARHFPRRNRLISGLARGLVVVEAAERSGSLITANFALEQGREIFAVPGSPLDPRARGTNRLIREGATLTENAEDVLSVLQPILGRDFREGEPDMLSSRPDQAALEAEADQVRQRIEEALSPTPVAVDELIRLTGAPVPAVLTVLLEMELAGRCRRHPGNFVSWC
jgi:DNA processing protein